MNKGFSLTALLYFLSLSGALAETYTVTSIAELHSRVGRSGNAVAGDRIIMANGTYENANDIYIGRSGTMGNPITIEAETIGGVIFTGTGEFEFLNGTSHVVLKGFSFQGKKVVNVGKNTHFIRITRNIFEQTMGSQLDGRDYLIVHGDDVEVDYNEFRDKINTGAMLDISESSTEQQVARRVWIHHNYFHNHTKPDHIDTESLLLGRSSLGASYGNALVEYNLFEYCDPGYELISNKSTGNTYRYNTFKDSYGTLTTRHGNETSIYGNYFIGTRGVRIYGDRNRIFSNYFYADEGIRLGSGTGEVADGDSIFSHDRPDDNVIAYNTLRDCVYTYNMTGSGTLGAVNTVFSYNIVDSNNRVGVFDSHPGLNFNPTFEGNIFWRIRNTEIPQSGYTEVDPLLAPDADGIYRLQSGSPAINAGAGTYPFVDVDMDGQTRIGILDVGADEFSGARMTAKLLTAADVGPFAVVMNPPPTYPTATPGNGSVSLDWNDSSDPDFKHYNIYRSTTTRTSYALIYSGALTSDYVDYSVSNETTYYYVVRSVNTSDDESSNSNEVFTTPTARINIAPNGTASQSSISNGGDPSRAIDGNTSGSWSDDSITHTSSQAQPWWELDLGASYDINEIVIWNRIDNCCIDRLTDFDVTILDSSEQVVWSNYQLNYPDPSITVFPNGITGQYVRVQLRGSGTPLSLAEVQVYAAPPNGSPIADSQSVWILENRPQAIELSGSDPNGDDLTYSIIDDPTNGVLSGNAPNLTYTPNENYTGEDSFTFVVSDGETTSATALISITVEAGSDLPVQAGLLMHLDAARLLGSNEGNFVERWPNLVNPGTDGIAEAMDSRPTYRANAFNERLPGVRFDGTDDWMDLGDLKTETEPFEVFVVAQSQDTEGSNWQNILSAFTDGPDNRTAPNWTLLRPHQNGLPELLSPSILTRESSADLHLDGLHLAVRGYDQNNHFRGDIAEVIIYGRTLDLLERTRIQYHLAHKYGLEIAGYLDPLLDTDQDGVSDYHELIAGTHPNDPSDYLSVEFGVANGNVQIQWRSVLERQYSVLRTTDFNTWTQVGDFTGDDDVILLFQESMELDDAAFYMLDVEHPSQQ